MLSKTGEAYEIVLIDDGSSDGSWDKMVEMSRVIQHLKLIKFRRNLARQRDDAGFRESGARL